MRAPTALLIVLLWVFNTSIAAQTSNDVLPQRANKFEATTSTDVACLGEIVSALLNKDPCMGQGMDLSNGSSLAGSYEQTGILTSVTTDEAAYVAARISEVQDAANTGLAKCGNNLRLKV